MKRRNFVKKAALSSLATFIGAEVVYGSSLPLGYDLLALEESDPFKLFNKHKDMTVLNDKPWNIEAKAHLLNDNITPNANMFIRNNGLLPEAIDAEKWTLTIDGESVENQKTYTLNDLKSKFEQYTYQLTLECGGNGRSEFDPPAKGRRGVPDSCCQEQLRGYFHRQPVPQRQPERKRR